MTEAERALSANVQVDVSQIDNLALQLDRVGKMTRKAIVASLNRAGDMGYTAAKRALSAQTGVKQSALEHGAEGLAKIHASIDTLEFRLIARSSTTPLSYFSPTQTKAGVAASPWNKRRTFSGTFMATMSSGHVGVFAHESGPQNYARRVSPTTGRIYYSATNIRQLWGPSIAKELLRGETPEAFKKTATDNFVPRLTHELERMVACMDPKQRNPDIPEPQA